MKARYAFIVIFLAGIGFVIASSFVKSPTIPDLTFADAEDNKITVDEILQENDYLLMVLLSDRDLYSKKAIQVLTELYPDYSESMEFLGLMIGGKSKAESLADEREIPFGVYAIRSGHDKMALNEFIEKAGRKGCVRSEIRTGDIVVVDFDREIVFTLKGDKLDEVGTELSGLLE